MAKVQTAAPGGVYGLVVLGALVYFLQTADSFIDGVAGVAMAIFWPAVIIYEVLSMLKV